MFQFDIIAEFSRSNCVSICAFLVPANLIATSLTLLLAVFNRPLIQLWQAAGVATVFAVVMLMHVFTWFSIGVVMIPTYVLLWLASTCLISNFGAIVYSAGRVEAAPKN